MGKRADAINASLELDETWSERFEEAFKAAAFEHYSEMIAAMLEVEPVDWDQVIEDWVAQFVVPILESNAEAMTEQEVAVAQRIAGSA